MRRRAAVLAVVSLALAAPVAGQAPGARPTASPSPDIDRVRAALQKYQDPITAIHDGYYSTLACIEFPVAGTAGQMSYPAGGMGVHFLNLGLVGPQLDSLRPQVLIYEPVGDTLRLVAAEWFVPAEVVRTRPQLFGRPFDGPMEGHHPVMPAALHHWDLHVWLWKSNPAGMFSPTNPALRCPPGVYSFQDQPPRMVAP